MLLAGATATRLSPLHEIFLSPLPALGDLGTILFRKDSVSLQPSMLKLGRKGIFFPGDSRLWLRNQPTANHGWWCFQQSAPEGVQSINTLASGHPRPFSALGQKDAGCSAGEHEAQRGESLVPRDWRVRCGCAWSKHRLGHTQVPTALWHLSSGRPPRLEIRQALCKKIMKYSCYERGIWKIRKNLDIQQCCVNCTTVPMMGYNNGMKTMALMCNGIKGNSSAIMLNISMLIIVHNPLNNPAGRLREVKTSSEVRAALGFGLFSFPDPSNVPGKHKSAEFTTSKPA